jgi:hypothetical protein
MLLFWKVFNVPKKMVMSQSMGLSFGKKRIEKTNYLIVGTIPLSN